MNQRSIKVSVIMACYNSSDFIVESVNSVLGQTLGDLELILIDDHSTDNTLEIAKQYQLQDDRVSVISLPVNSGPAIARNAGIDIAKGKWIGILDSDDIATTYRFEEQIKLADRDSSLVMISSDSKTITANGYVIKENKYPTDHKRLTNRLYTSRAFPAHSSMLYLKDSVKEVGAFNKRFVPSEDRDLWLRLSESGKMASIKKPLVMIRKHEKNISGKSPQLKFSYAASICHFLRIQGCPDPSTSSDDQIWEYFLQWIDKRVIEESGYEQHSVQINAHAKYCTADNRVSGILSYISCLLRSGYGFTLIREKMFGARLPKYLSEEWCRNLLYSRK